MSAQGTIEITAQPANLSESDAIDRVQDRLLAKIKSTITTIDPVRAELRYKPFYAYDVTLTKKVFRGEDDVREGTIIVDGMSDIARPFTSEEIEEEPTNVPEEQVIQPQVSESEATITANSRRMQVEHREGGDLQMVEDPRLAYKPVWLVELSNGQVRVVDAVDGSVFDDMLLG